tara:strand:+ start:2244 stop:2621 length:378 start_codon:yes stop_codon:yes gene_type:complete
MFKKRLSVNKNVKRLVFNSLFFSMIAPAILNPINIEASNRVTMKSQKSTKVGHQGSVFYQSKKHKTVSKSMHPEIESPQATVQRQWASVSFSPDEAYVNLQKKGYLNRKSSQTKQLSFSEVARQH